MTLIITDDIRQRIMNDEIITEGVFKHLFLPYDYFHTKLIHKYFKYMNEFCYENGAYKKELIFKDITFSKPEYYPYSIIGVGGMSYTTQMSVTVEYKTLNKSTGITSTEVYKNVPYFILPVMVRSELCNLHGLSREELKLRGEEPDEIGGYYIDNGLPKVPITQKRANNNMINIEMVYSSNPEQEKYFKLTKFGITDGDVVCNIASYSERTTSRRPIFLHLPSNLRPLRMSIYQFNTDSSAEPMDIKYFFLILKVSNADLFRLLSPPDFINEDLTNIERSRWKEIITSIIESEGNIDNKKDFLPDLSKEYTQEVVDAKVHKKIYNFIHKLTLSSEVDEPPPETTRECKIKEKNAFDDVFLNYGNEPSWNKFSERDDLCFYLSHVIRMMVYNLIKKTSPYFHGNLAQDRYLTPGQYLCEEIVRLSKTAQYDTLKKLVPDERNKTVKTNALDDLSDFELYGKWKACLEKKQKDIEIYLSKGERTVSIGSYNKKSWVENGLTELRKTTNRYAKISMARKINTMDNNIKSTKEREVSQSSMGFKDGTNTPEGKGISINIELALSTQITIHYFRLEVLSTINKYMRGTNLLILIENATVKDNVRYYPLLINDTLSGYVSNPDQFYEKVTGLIQDDKLYSDISVYVDRDSYTVNIRCDYGRLKIPVFDIQNISKNLDLTLSKDERQKFLNNMLVSYSHAVKNRYIVWLDMHKIQHTGCVEVNTDRSRNGQYLFLHGLQIFGSVINSMPFVNQNLPPRIQFNSQQMIQSMGNSSALHLAVDKNSYRFKYAQVPVVTPKMNFILNNYKSPTGRLINVMIGPYKGFNQEDGIVFNQTSIDNGMFNMDIVKTESVETQYKHENSSTFTDYNWNVKPSTQMIRETSGKIDFRFLDDNGIIMIGTVLREGMALMFRSRKDYKLQVIASETPARKSKYITTSKREKYVTEEINQSYVATSEYNDYVVDDISYNFNKNNKYVFFFKLVYVNQPQIGDKFTTRHSQKTTNGYSEPAERLPRTADGSHPDVIINNSCFPSRMTISQWVEMLYNIKSLATGRFIDATAFNGTSEDNIKNILEYIDGRDMVKMWNEHNEEILTPMVFGPIHFENLIHLVFKKEYAINEGYRDPITSQSLRGRKVHGGTRIDEMQKEIIIAAGSLGVLEDRFRWNSENYIADIDPKTHSLSNKPKSEVQIETSRATINLLHYIRGFNVDVEMS